jgi:glyoxylase-like metal-dependent hydrolase (beta-lactamase superfamily II)
MVSSEGETTEVAEGVHRYGSRYINCYLIEDRGRLTLLDTGLPSYVRNLRGALSRLGRSVRDIDAIILTHCHIDHMGSAERVRFESNGRVFAHAADVPPLRGDRRVPVPNLGTKMMRPFLMRYLFGHLIPNGAARYPTIAEVTAFADGERLDVPGSPRVVHTPGHTPGTSALVLEERKALFSGDALVMLDTLTGKVGPHVFEPPLADDYGEALASVDRLAEIDASVILPGHGGPWRGSVAEAARIARSNSPRVAS